MPAHDPSVKATPAKGLNHWRKELLKVSLPALSETGVLLMHQLKKPDVSLHDIEKIVHEDPVLSFQMLAKANQFRPNPDNDIFSLPHALSLLGMDKLQPLLRKVKYIRFDTRKAAHNAFLQALNTSLHAATQASRIAEQKQPGSGESNYWIALRLSSVFWLLALASPRTYHAVEKRVQAGESRPIVENDIMGCTTQQLTCSMLADWKLSTQTQTYLNQLLSASPRTLGKMSRCAWQKEFAPEIPKSLGHFLQTPWLPAVLGHWLALNTAVNWYTPKTWRVERMIATYLHRPVDEVVPFLHRNACRFALNHSFNGVWSPAVKLLHPPLEKRPVTQPTKDNKSSAQTVKRKKDLSYDRRKRAELKPVRQPVADPKRGTNPQPSAKPDRQNAPKTQPKQAAVQTALFKLFYMQTVQQRHVTSIHQMMDGASQVMQFDLGLTRCILFMKSRSRKAVKGVYAKGFTDNTPFADMELAADSAHLFGKLLNKQAALRVTPENKPRYVPELPDGLWPVLEHPDEFVLSSIMLRGRVSGILYADNKNSSKPMTASHYATFRALAQAISSGMDILAQRKEQAHNKLT